MKAAAALLLALFALTGSIGVRAPLGLSGQRAMRCVIAKPCCKPAPQDMPTVRATMACCDVVRVGDQQQSPAVTVRPAVAVLVAVLTIPTGLVPAAASRVESGAPSRSPTGPPIFLRNRSLLL